MTLMFDVFAALSCADLEGALQSQASVSKRKEARKEEKCIPILEGLILQGLDEEQCLHYCSATCFLVQPSCEWQTARFEKQTAFQCFCLMCL